MDKELLVGLQADVGVLGAIEIEHKSFIHGVNIIDSMVHLGEVDLSHLVKGQIDGEDVFLFLIADFDNNLLKGSFL